MIRTEAMTIHNDIPPERGGDAHKGIRVEVVLGKQGNVQPEGKGK